MNVSVAGLWHLGTVTAACLAAAGHEVVGYDEDPKTIEELKHARLPVFEPGLETLVRAGVTGGHLRLTNDPDEALIEAAVLVLAWDTPVDDDDRADVESVVNRAENLFRRATPGTLVVVSSQLPVGTTAWLERRCAALRPKSGITFACVPENLRLGQAIDTFRAPARIVAGTRSEEAHGRIVELFKPFTDRFEWMSVESAELTKHALNAFLATSVAFANEIGAMAERVGADALEVARGLKSDPRVGPRAYVAPGGPFGGGTLARDLMYLTERASALGVPSRLLSSVVDSNDAHRGWALGRLQALLGSLSGRTVAVWGLAYKAGTDTLRRSDAVALCEALSAKGATVRAFDPLIRELPAELAGGVILARSALDAAHGSDAVAISTNASEFKDVVADDLVAAGAPIVLDPNRFLVATLGHDPRLRYVAVGVPDREQPRRDVRHVPRGRPRSGWSALVTGASRGFGFAVARALLTAGADVMLCARDVQALGAAQEALVWEFGSCRTILAQAADVSSPRDNARLVAATLDGFPDLGVLVNNAGVYGPKGPVEQVNWGEWIEAVEINLFGSVLLSRSLVPHFKQRGSGKIIQISGGGATAPLPFLSAYAASKAAVVRFAETLAEELGPFHIAVNAVAPGALNTRMLDEVLAAGPAVVGDVFFAKAERQKLDGGTPLELGADLCAFLASPASDGITGKLLSAVWDPWRELPARHADIVNSDIYTLRRIVPGDRGKTWGRG
jgi:UDPglucose 6-dehydrogenase